MSRTKVLFGMLGLGLLVAACGGEPETAPPAPRAEGPVALIDGEEISEGIFQERYAQIVSIPAVAEQLQAQGPALEETIRAQLLSQLIVAGILFPAAEEDFGIEISDADVQERFDQMEQAAGGADAFAQQIEETWGSRELLVEQELPFTLMIERVHEEFGGEEVPQPPAPGEQPEPTEAELAVEEWALGKLAEADVTVRSDIGTWDPQTGQVHPPGALGGMGPGVEPPPG